MTPPTRTRGMTILRVTAGYLVVWGAAVSFFWLLAVAWPDSEGPEFNWTALGMTVLASFVVLVAGHVVWGARTAQALAGYGRPWRAALTVVAPPLSLVLIPFGVNESVLPWQLWFVALIVVPAGAAGLATAQR